MGGRVENMFTKALETPSVPFQFTSEKTLSPFEPPPRNLYLNHIAKIKNKNKIKMPQRKPVELTNLPSAAGLQTDYFDIIHTFDILN